MTPHDLVKKWQDEVDELVRDWPRLFRSESIQTLQERFDSLERHTAELEAVLDAQEKQPPPPETDCENCSGHDHDGNLCRCGWGVETHNDYCRHFAGGAATSYTEVCPSFKDAAGEPQDKGD